MPAIFTSEIDALSATFAALSDPTRRAMLARLSLGEASVNELAVPFKMSLPAVSKHIKVLEKAGLLTKTINAQQRPCKIDGAQLKLAVDWIIQNTTNSIAPQAINTPARGRKSTQKRSQTENPSKSAKTPKSPKAPKLNIQPKEKPHDNSQSNEPSDPNNIQQQIGFDF